MSAVTAMKSHLLAILVLTCVSSGEIQEALETAIKNSQRLGGAEVRTLMYVPPSEGLRRAADKMDREDAERRQVADVLHRLKAYGVCYSGTEHSHYQLPE